MGLPPFPQRAKATPAIGGREFDGEDIAQLPIKIGRSRLRPLEHPHRDVAQRRQTLSHDPQRHGFPRAGFARDQSETALLHELLDPPGEVFDPGSHEQCLARQLRRARVPLQSPQR